MPVITDKSWKKITLNHENYPVTRGFYIVIAYTGTDQAPVSEDADFDWKMYVDFLRVFGQ